MKIIDMSQHQPIPEEDSPVKLRTRMYKWVIRKLNTLAFHISRLYFWSKLNWVLPITALVIMLLICLYVFTESWWMKQIFISKMNIVRVAKAESRPLTLEEYICTKDWNCKTAIAVAKAESGMRCDAQNINKGTNSLDAGIFQINSVHLRKGWKVAELLDCRRNVDLAYEIYKGSGWGAWSAYKNGSYKKFLN